MSVIIPHFDWCFSTETKAAVTDPDTEGIEYIDERVDSENNNIDRDEETKSDLDEYSDKESEEDPGALHINKVNLKSNGRESERARPRVCVEIKHPALKLPVYRMWAGTTWQTGLDAYGSAMCSQTVNCTNSNSIRIHSVFTGYVFILST